MPTIQKASFLKRISAFLLDAILVVILATGFASVVSSLVKYDQQAQLLNSYYSKHEQIIQDKFPGVDFDITEEDYNKLTPEQKKQHQDAISALETAVKEDAGAAAVFQMLATSTITIVSASALLSILSVYFVAPLFFKNGQTVGKKIFGLGLMRTNCVKVSNKALLIRVLFGMYAIEVMFPVGLILAIYYNLLNIVGLITIGLFLILQIGVMIYSRTNSCIHDLISDTIVIDFGSQRIFDTEEARIAYVTEQQARQAAESAY